MDNQQEVWDLFDKDLKPKGKFIKGNGYIPTGLYHKTVEVIPTDMQGNLLLIRRSLQKKKAPGLLEFPAGSVMSEETEKAAALRELQEETGLQAKELFFLQRVRTKGLFRYTYLAYVPNMTECKIRYEPSEVMGHIFVSFEQWQEIITSGSYNISRAYYSEKLFDLVKKLVNQKASEKIKVEASSNEQPPLTETTVLKNSPKANVLGYNENVDSQQDDWEPSFERGDDGA